MFADNKKNSFMKFIMSQIDCTKAKIEPQHKMYVEKTYVLSSSHDQRTAVMNDISVDSQKRDKI